MTKISRTPRFFRSASTFIQKFALPPHIITNSWDSSQQNGPLSAANQALDQAAAMRRRLGGRHTA